MSNVELSYERLPYIDGELELTDDRQSCRLFLAATLDHAAAERAEQVSFKPNDADKSLTVVMGRCVHPMVPLPCEVRTTYFRFIQEMVLGRLFYFLRVHLNGRPFARNECGCVAVDVGGRRSRWTVECTRESIRFVRVS